MLQNTEQFSKEFINSIKTIEGIPCYVKVNQSDYVVLAIHEHLGLVQNFTQIVNKFVQNTASILIPDLFCGLQDQQIDQDDEFSLLKNMNISQVDSILRTCIQYAKNKNKKIILLGFSIGASLGLKLIERMKDVSFGVFFYGYPIFKCLQPEKIRCPILIFHAINDKIKYLSDQEQLKKIMKVYSNYSYIKIQNIDSSHGFMNPQHPNFDQKSLKYCKKLFHEMLKEIDGDHGNQKINIQEKKTQNTKKQQQSGGCSIF